MTPDPHPPRWGIAGFGWVARDYAAPGILAAGGRMIDAILTNTLLPELSRGVLNRAIEDRKLIRVTVGTGEGGFTYAFE